jgi:predicted alpha/beta-hydrolase family hydrolase
VIEYPAAQERSLHVLFVFAHGAGAGERHPFMTAFGHALAARGIDVVTFNFPYMDQKRRVPDKAPVLEARFRDVVAAARQGARTSHRLFLGGKSMGGRIATHLAAQGGVDALGGVIALGYPLHPPGRPEQPRTAHLPAITSPVLIVQGEHDAFGTPSELAPVIATMQAPVTLHVVAGGDHSFKVRGRRSDEVYPPVFDAIIRFCTVDAGAPAAPSRAPAG